MAEKILIIDDDVDTLRLVGLMLQRQGYQISAATNGEQGLSKAFEENPDLILLDVMMPDLDGYEVTRRLRKNPSTATTPILMFTAKTQLDDKVTGFEVGADDYLTKPTHPSELQTHVKALLGRTPQKDSGAATEAEEQNGSVIGVLAARGGLGVSAVASNVAAGLFTRTQADVVLAELIPGHGTLGPDLGAGGQESLNELLSGSSADVTREKVQKALIPHITGLKLLLASGNPRHVNLTAQIANYEMLIARLATFGRFVVLDLGVGLPTFVQKLLPRCNELVVVIEGVPNSIQHSKLLIEELIALGVDRKAILAVLNNRVRTETQMAWTDVQDKLGHPIATTLTPAPELFFQSVRMQSLAVMTQPTNVTSQQFLKIADLVIEREKMR